MGNYILDPLTAFTHITPCVTLWYWVSVFRSSVSLHNVELLRGLTHSRVPWSPVHIETLWRPLAFACCFRLNPSVVFWHKCESWSDMCISGLKKPPTIALADHAPMSVPLVGCTQRPANMPVNDVKLSATPSARSVSTLASTTVQAPRRVDIKTPINQKLCPQRNQANTAAALTPYKVNMRIHTGPLQPPVHCMQ